MTTQSVMAPIRSEQDLRAELASARLEIARLAQMVEDRNRLLHGSGQMWAEVFETYATGRLVAVGPFADEAAAAAYVDDIEPEGTARSNGRVHLQTPDQFRAYMTRPRNAPCSLTYTDGAAGVR